MSIPKFIKRLCVQTAIYWGSPVDDGYGKKEFDDPVEIKVRWDDTTDLIRSVDGKEVACKSKIIVQQDVDLGGYLMLGSLDDIDSGLSDTPQDITGAYEIIRLDKTPLFRKTDQFVRTAYV